MFELGAGVGAVANLAFGLIGVWMAHSLYRATRKRWQSVLAWVLIFLVWTFGAGLLGALLPGVPYVRVSMLVGFTGIFVYLYLFGDIPIEQRIFTYFMVDTSMTLLVLFARVAAQTAGQATGMGIDALFLTIYPLCAAGFMVMFHCKLKAPILSALGAFSGHLSMLAVFAASGYITLLLVVDPWAPWSYLDIWAALGWLAMILLILMSYLLAFRTLTGILAHREAESEFLRLSEQLVFSERYYDSLTERMEQSRMQNHDLRHHVNTLTGLCAEENWTELRRYVEGMNRDLPTLSAGRYCDSSTVNALLEYYAGLCKVRGVLFDCRIKVAGLRYIQPTHLCVILGNALQNALEAVERLPSGSAKELTVKAAFADGRLAIECSNPFSGELMPDGQGQPRSSKAEQGHGLGLQSIRETVRRYGGWCGIRCEDGQFTLQVTLPDVET